MAKQSLKLTRAHRNMLGKAGIKSADLWDYRYLTVNKDGTYFVKSEGTPEEIRCMVTNRGKLVILE